jgi:hypothetical protein
MEAPNYTKQQIDEILDAADIVNTLTASQVMTVILWGFINKKKSIKFVENLDSGMSARYAFIKAKSS